MGRGRGAFLAGGTAAAVTTRNLEVKVRDSGGWKPRGMPRRSGKEADKEIPREELEFVRG